MTASPAPAKKQARISREIEIRADRERVYVVIAYTRPPGYLCMKLAESGKTWYRRGTGVYVADLALELVRCGITGRIKSTQRYLAGTPNWVPYKRTDSDEQEETDPRRMGPVQFARRYKDATPLWAQARDKGQSARPATVQPPLTGLEESHKKPRRGVKKARASGFAPMVAHGRGLPTGNLSRAGGRTESQPFEWQSRAHKKQQEPRPLKPRGASVRSTSRIAEQYSLAP